MVANSGRRNHRCSCMDWCLVRSCALGTPNLTRESEANEFSVSPPKLSTVTTCPFISSASASTH
ncbi:hypothetical protein BT69DRAFT_1277477 [Atractiella rhizophila]|nr:hypothetical protein BT69DRAFT_1277477 [Atractiella rhizophila]